MKGAQLKIWKRMTWTFHPKFRFRLDFRKKNLQNKQHVIKCLQCVNCCSAPSSFLPLCSCACVLRWNPDDSDGGKHTIRKKQNKMCAEWSPARPVAGFWEEDRSKRGTWRIKWVEIHDKYLYFKIGVKKSFHHCLLSSESRAPLTLLPVHLREVLIYHLLPRCHGHR